MRWRALGLVSIAVNLLLAAAWLISARHISNFSVPGSASTAASSSDARTNVVVRRQFFSWQEVESTDYPTYIANLRDIGCPEQTIRDIIIADVNSLFARRRATELVTANQQWWRSEPDTNVVIAAAEKIRALEEERRALLTKLLGPNWEAGDMLGLPRPSRRGVVLDGPVLGVLPADTKLVLEDISNHSQERLQAYLDSVRKEGKNPDPAELAKLRQQTRDELTRILSPPQLEEFLLRYSQEATDLRAALGQLQFFNSTPDEFRALFRATDDLDAKIQSLQGDDPNTVLARNALEAQRENAIKIALGPKRYEEYRNLQDPLYRDAVETAQNAGTPDAAQTIYQINLAAASQQGDILANTNLSTDQRNIELKRLELEQLQANALATGQDVPPEPPMPESVSPPRRTYVMQPGDTVAVVSIIYGVPISAIQALNPNVNLNRLRPGDSLFIPQNPLAPSQ